MPVGSPAGLPGSPKGAGVPRVRAVRELDSSAVAIQDPRALDAVLTLARIAYDACLARFVRGNLEYTNEQVYLEALRAARAAGMGALEAIAAEHAPDDEDQAEIARAYLQDNVQFELTADGLAGLKKFYGAARDLGIVQSPATVHFYGS